MTIIVINPADLIIRVLEEIPRIGYWDSSEKDLAINWNSGTCEMIIFTTSDHKIVFKKCFRLEDYVEDGGLTGYILVDVDEFIREIKKAIKIWNDKGIKFQT